MNMRNQLKANIVSLEIGNGVWFANTIAYDGVSHNGCLLIWDHKSRQLVEYRPSEIGTAEFCEAIAAQWNEWKAISQANQRSQ